MTVLIYTYVKNMVHGSNTKEYFRQNLFRHILLHYQEL